MYADTVNRTDRLYNVQLTVGQRSNCMLILSIGQTDCTRVQLTIGQRSNCMLIMLIGQTELHCATDSGSED